MKVIDDLIDSYAPLHTEFAVEVLGAKMRFRVLSGHKEYNQLKNGGAMFARNVIGAQQNPPTGSVHESWREYLTDDAETLGWVNTLAETCLEEGASHLDFLKLQHKLPVVFGMIKDQFAALQLRMADGNDAAEVEHLKND
jgi:hypothetical protein